MATYNVYQRGVGGVATKLGHTVQRNPVAAEMAFARLLGVDRDNLFAKADYAQVPA